MAQQQKRCLSRQARLRLTEPRYNYTLPQFVTGGAYEGVARELTVL